MWRCWLLLMCLGTGLVSAVRDIHNDADAMPGWLGSDYESPVYKSVANVRPSRKIEVLNEDARVYMIRNFLSPEECDALIKGAEPRLSRSGVSAVAEDGYKEHVVHPDYRTSYNMFYQRGENPVVADVERRIAMWSLIPASHGEGLQVLRYALSQRYDAHMDYLWTPAANHNGGPRCATVLMYLSDVEEGGETYFPNLPEAGNQEKGLSKCARGHLAVKPRRGDAILFWSIAPSGEIDNRSMHGSCPVLKGTKWAVTKWMHVGEFKY